MGQCTIAKGNLGKDIWEKKFTLPSTLFSKLNTESDPFDLLLIADAKIWESSSRTDNN